MSLKLAGFDIWTQPYVWTLEIKFLRWRNHTHEFGICFFLLNVKCFRKNSTSTSYQWSVMINGNKRWQISRSTIDNSSWFINGQTNRSSWLLILDRLDRRLWIILTVDYRSSWSSVFNHLIVDDLQLWMSLSSSEHLNH